jgi:outer membrane autotransporter protein
MKTRDHGNDPGQDCARNYPTGIRPQLLVTTALAGTAGFFFLSVAALAGPDGCVQNGNTVTCSGDQSDGVLEPTDYQSPPVQIFIIDSTTAITPVAGNSGVDASGDDVGLYDMTVRVPNGIFITGDLAAGINAGLASPVVPGPIPLFDGNVRIDSVADISANGTRLQGISAFVSGSGNVTVTSVGNITVNTSADAFGEAINTSIGEIGNIAITSTGNIMTTNAEGISADGAISDIGISSTGDIGVSGDGVEAIVASTVDGNISIQSVGNITADGSAGHGIATIFNGNVSVSSQGDITTSGPNSAAFALIRGAEAATGTIAQVTSNGNISATGANSFGIFGSLDDNMFGQFMLTGNVTATASALQVEMGAGVALFDLSDGTYAGGTGAAVDIPNVLGVENAFVSINTDALTTLTATSGNAVISNSGATTINNSGVIDGSVLLRPDGSNRINNLAGAAFAPRGSALVGAGNFIVNDGTFSPFGLGTLGVTQVTGNLFSGETATYQIDISDLGSDATSVDGQFVLNGTLSINATTPENTFAVNDVFSIADATGGIFGAFSSATDNLANFEIVPLISRDRSQLAAVLTTDGIYTSGDCSSVGGVVVCSGNQSDGISNIGLMPDFASLTSNRLVVENLTQPVGAPTGEPAIEVFVNNPAGFFADIDLGTQGISTTGQGQRGIEVINAGGAVSIESAGDISTTGRNANGIVGLTTGGGDVSINSSSNISTTAIDTHAVIAETQNENGSITIANSGEIVATGDLSKGLLASVREIGDIGITNSGTITAADDAIFAAARRGGNITIDNTANLAGGGDASIFAEVGDSGAGNGNITINSVGNLSFSSGQFANGIDAGVEGNGNIDITSIGDISANGTFGTGISGRVGGLGDVAISSTGNVISSSTGIAGSGDNTLIEHTGNIDSGSTAIFASGSESVSINSSGNIDATAASFTGAIDANPDGDATLSVNHTGDIRVSLEGIGNTVIGSGILVETGNVFSTQAVDTTVDFTGNIVFAEGLGIVDSQNFLDNQRLSAGISLVSISSRDMMVNSNGNITSDNPNVHGIAAIIRSGNPNAFGDIDITSDGNISVTGENADGIRTRGTVGNTTSVTIDGGSVLGGTGDSGSGVEFRGALGAIGTLNVNAGTVSALSGVAVRGLDGSETINNAGTITGSVLLGGGMNSFNNLAGGRFNSGINVDLGGGVLLNSGTLAPGNSIGTTLVNGDFTQTTAGMLEIEIAGDGTSDRVDVTGSAALAGTLSVFGLGYPTGFPDAQTYTIMTATGGMNGNFDSVSDNLPDVDVMVTYNPNDVIIGYQRAVTPSDVSPKEVYPNLLQAGLGAPLMFTRYLTERGHIPRTNDPFSPASGASTHAFAIGGDPNGASSGFDAGGIATWAQLVGRTSQIGANGGVRGYDSNIWGLFGGADLTFARESGIGRIGMAFGYTGTDVDMPGSSGSIEMWHAGIYGGIEDGPVSASGALTYGWQDYDFARAVALGGGGGATAKGSADGEVFSASGKFSWNVADRLGLEDGSLTRFAPTLAIDHIYAQRDNLTESGAGVLNLTIPSDSISQTWVSAGIELSTRLELDNGMTATPSLSVMYGHNFGDRKATANSSIPLASANFKTAGVTEDADLLAVGAGLAIELGNQTSLSFSYDGAYGSKTRNHSGKAGLTIRF